MPGDARFSASPHVTLMKNIVKGYLNDLNTIIPGKVSQYNQQTGRAKVQPLSKIILNLIDEEGKNQSLEVPSLDNIPVCFFGSPSVNLTHKVKVGDTGLLLVSQRSVDEFKASHLADPENPSKAVPYASKDFRKFDINDSMFFPIYFSGNKGFQGLKDKANARIGFKSEGMAQLKGRVMELTEVVEDQQSQISMLQSSVRTVAGSNPWTAPSMAAVVGNEIVSRVKHAINFAKQQLSFSSISDAELINFLRDAGTRVVGFAIEAGRARAMRQNPEEMLQEMRLPPGIEVAVQQKKITGTGFFNFSNLFGWTIKGLDASNSFFPAEGVGDADFSVLARLDRIDLSLKRAEENEELMWADLVGVIMSTDSQIVYMDLYWPHEVSLSATSVRRVRVYVREFDTGENTLIGTFPLPMGVTSEVGNTVGPLYGVRLTIDLTNNGGTPIDINDSYKYSQQSSIFGSLFGSDNDLAYPFLTFKFFDSSDNEIVSPK